LSHSNQFTTIIPIHIIKSTQLSPFSSPTNLWLDEFNEAEGPREHVLDLPNLQLGIGWTIFAPIITLVVLANPIQDAILKLIGYLGVILVIGHQIRDILMGWIQILGLDGHSVLELVALF